MAKKLTKDQLSKYIAALSVWQMADIESFINSLIEEYKNMPDEKFSNPPGVPPPPPRH